MNVLYVNHTGRMSGAELSLLTLLGELPAQISPVVTCPTGPFADAVRRLGIPVASIPALDASLRLHPLHTTRGLAAVAKVGMAIREQSRRYGAGIIHANSIRAGLCALPATPLGGAPVLVHVRDCLPLTSQANLVRRLTLRGAALVIANSHYTAANFGGGFRGAGKLRVVHNAVDLRQFAPERLDRAAARKRLGIPEFSACVGVVAQLSPWKGQDDAIRALALLREHQPAARLLIVGQAKFTATATRFDNNAYAARLQTLVREFGLGDSVSFLGERDDVPQILRALDLLLVPSWVEPFGRTIIEAMAMETAVIATSIGGSAEIVADGADGLLLPPRQPQLWADAMTGLLPDRARRLAMGAAGRAKVVDRFSAGRHVRDIVRLYEETLERGPRRGRAVAVSAGTALGTSAGTVP